MGSGKSSTSQALAKRFDRSAVIEVDKLRAMVVGGFVRPSPYNEEVELQLSLAAKNACQIASNFLENGFSVFIDAQVGRKLLKQYSEYFRDTDFKIFLLLPSLESLLERYDKRGDYPELRERTIELYKLYTDKKDSLNCETIDSSNQTLEETTDQIYKALIAL